MINNILLSGIGGDIAQGVAKIIREYDDQIKLIGTDIHERHGGEAYVDHYVEVPRADSSCYTDVMHKIIDQHHVETIFLLTEFELEKLDSLQKGYENLSWISAGKRVIDIGLDKFKTYESLVKAGITMPWTIPVEQSLPIDYPCIMKSRTGSGSKNIFFIKDKYEAEFFRKRYPNSIFQELLLPDTQEVTCAIFRSSEKKVFTLQMLRELSGGLTGWAKVIYEPEVEELCRLIANTFDLSGSMNIQMRITPAGPRIFEINPRFSSTTLMRHRAGFTDVVWSLQMFSGETIDYQPISEETQLLRQYDALIMDPY